MKRKQPGSLKIILYIAGNDIRSTIKNKTTIGILIGVLMMILPSQLIPLILDTESVPIAVIYAPGEYSLAQQLSSQPDIRAIQVTSLLEMEDEVVNRGDKVIGLVFPNDFTLDEPSPSGVEVTGLFPHWTSDEVASTLIESFTTQLTDLTQNEVQIIPAVDRVYPTEDTHGFEVMFILQMINAVLTITLILVPQLIMIEKESHTLDALLVSPASWPELIIGKGIAGAFYSILTTALVLALNSGIIVHWGWLTISQLSGIIFAVLIGLLIGLLFENYQKATLVMSVLMILIIGPPFVIMLVRTTLSPVIAFLVHWLPSGALATLIQMCLFESVEIAKAWSALVIIWAFNLILVSAIGLQIRKINKNG